MNELAKIEAAKKLAPSYLKLKDDGADFKCNECGLSQKSTKAKPFVVIYTPDGVRHSAVHLECLDKDWVKNARDMGEI